MKEDTFAFTKKKLDTLPLPDGKDRACYFDSKANGLLLRVTSTGTKSFQVRRRVNGKAVRVTLGRYPGMTIEQARKKALAMLSTMVDGVSPNAAKKANKARAVTLREVFEDYLKARKSLKPGTVYDYRATMRQTFSDWMSKPMRDITRDMVARRHSKRGAESEARANNAMRVLRALFTFAAGEYEDENGNPLFSDNPVTRISHTKAWYRVERRRRILKSHELPEWWAAVASLDSQSFRDYFQFLLLTGLRREEAARLEWSRVDLDEKTFTIADTKNREPHTLPLSDYLHHMLVRRRRTAINRYVFPSTASRTGHLINPAKQIKKVTEQSGIEFSSHDLRRTFITIAESLDIPAYALKQMLNHKMTSDVTAGYVIMNVARLRQPMQQITDYMLKAAGVKPTAEVIDIHGKAKAE